MTDLTKELEDAHREIAELKAERQRPLRLKQVAAELGVSEKTIRRMAKRGLASKPAGVWLFDRATVIEAKRGDR